MYLMMVIKRNLFFAIVINSVKRLTDKSRNDVVSGGTSLKFLSSQNDLMRDEFYLSF